ncbi:MAG TPA: GNAT family N-acetyltransferase, partial [Actinomycetota bacterium]|nr:GNAT family N-acetyltransferase [Actinomycetota bacterium]
MRIREAADEDLGRLHEIFVAAWEHLHERYAPRRPGPGDPGERMPFLRHLRRTGLVVVADDPEPVGFAAAIVREGVWFLSQLWVLPEHHGSGVGAALLDEALVFGRGASAFSTMSSPHPAAQLLYLRASMFPMWVSMEMAGGDGAAGERPDGVRDLVGDDQGWVDDLDREVRGAARPEDHAYWRTEEVTALALERPDGPAGYAYVWPDGKVGPGAVRDPGDVSIAIEASRLAGGSTFSVPSVSWRALGELVRLGFRPTGATTTFMA